MMPGIGFGEMVLLAIVAIVVVGPRDLPLMMRKFGRFTGKMRAMAFEFRQGFEELGRQAELEELRREVADLKKHTGLQEIEDDLRKDRINLEKDVDAALAPTAAPRIAAGPTAAMPAAAAAPQPPSPEPVAAVALPDDTPEERSDQLARAPAIKQDVPA
jgi:sec-independent protein translocase protein TatB